MQYMYAAWTNAIAFFGVFYIVAQTQGYQELGSILLLMDNIKDQGQTCFANCCQQVSWLS